MQLCGLSISLQVFGISNVSAKPENKQQIKASLEKKLSSPSECELMQSFPAEPIETQTVVLGDETTVHPLEIITPLRRNLVMVI